MSEFVKKLEEVKRGLNRNEADSVTVKWLAVDLVEAVIQEFQRLNKRIDDLEAYTSEIGSDLDGHRK